MSRAAVLVLCICMVLCSTITSARNGNLSACVDGEWQTLERAIANSGCAEKLVNGNLLGILRGNHGFEDILDQELHLCQVFVRLTSMLVSKNRLGDLCMMGVVDHETTPLLCAKTAELVHLATALQNMDDAVLSATAEVLQKWKEEAVCEITCTPGFRRCTVQRYYQIGAQRPYANNDSQERRSSRKLLSDDDDLRNAFQKNLPVTNEQIDAFNRGERQFINEQLTLLTLKQEDIQQEMEKASLELMEDEDYKTFLQRSPTLLSPQPTEDGNFYVVAMVMIVALVIIAYCIGRWKVQTFRANPATKENLLKKRMWSS
eukprot:Em0019g715a